MTDISSIVGLKGADGQWAQHHLEVAEVGSYHHHHHPHHHHPHHPDIGVWIEIFLRWAPVLILGLDRNLGWELFYDQVVTEPPLTFSAKLP